MCEAKCDDCGLDYSLHGLDIVLNDADWALIAPEKDVLLCGVCISNRSANAGFGLIRATLLNPDPVKMAPEQAEAFKANKHIKSPTYFKLDDDFLFRWSRKKKQWVLQHVSQHWQRHCLETLDFLSAESRMKFAVWSLI